MMPFITLISNLLLNKHHEHHHQQHQPHYQTITTITNTTTTTTTSQSNNDFYNIIFQNVIKYSIEYRGSINFITYISKHPCINLYVNLFV